MFRVVKGRETLIKMFSIYERKRDLKECALLRYERKRNPYNECVPYKRIRGTLLIKVFPVLEEEDS
jgi:hypothetical protein